MSTPADIRAAWLAAIWTNATILAFTDKIYDYDITQESEFERAKLLFDQEVNFFTYLTLRAPVQFFSGADECVQFDHRVSVNYYMEADPAGSNYNTVIDRLVAVESLVITGLTRDWSGTVDFYRLQTVNEPTLIEVNERPVWRGQNIYLAKEKTNYS